MSRYFAVQPAPFGAVTPVVDERGRVVELWTSDAADRLKGTCTESASNLRHVAEQLAAYFNRRLEVFDLPLAPDGSTFQRSVWDLLLQIPYGQTRTYGDLAGRLGGPTLARAVGRANATNPIAIVVPCHRVIGASGDLTGYAGGVDVKRKLLEIESGSSALF